MAITFDEAYQQTDPSHSDTQRQESARLLMLGSLANDVYWSSRPIIEALQAKVDGHGVIVRNTSDEPATPTAMDQTSPHTISETTSEEVTPSPADILPPPVPHPAPSPDNPVSAVAKLRAQLLDAGLEPEA